MVNITRQSIVSIKPLLLVSGIVLLGGIQSGCSTLANGGGGGEQALISGGNDVGTHASVSSKSKHMHRADSNTDKAPPFKLEKEPVETKIAPHLLYKLLVAEIAAQRGHLDVAVKNYFEVAEKTKDANAVKRATQMANYAQDSEKALQSAQLWVSSEPDNSDAHFSLAGVLLKLGRAADAVAEYQIVVSMLPQKQLGKGYNLISSQLARHPDRSVAMAVMEQLVEKNQKVAEAVYALSHLAMRQAKFNLALESVDKALVLKSTWPAAVILKARILAIKDGKDKAVAYLKSVAEGHLSDNIQVGLSYARMLAEARNLPEAFNQFERLSELAPRNAEVRYLSGVIALQQKELDKARDHLLMVLRLGTRIHEANYYLGQVAEQVKDLKTAITRYSTVKRGELYFGAQVRVVSILADQKEYDRAAEHLHTIRTSDDKQQLQLYLLEGDLLREQQRYKEAKQFYSKLLESQPDETSVRYARALVAEKLGELDLLESDLQSILAKDPKNAQVLNALGYTLADRTDRYQEALQYIQKAYELEPNDAAVMDSLGWVQYRLGNYNDAVNILRKANEIAQDPEIAAHLGEVLWVKGNKSAALEIWEASLKKHPKDEFLLKVMKRFGL